MQFLRGKLLSVFKAIVLLAAIALFNLGFASSVNHISERAYWMDTSGSAGISQAQDQIFTPYQGVLSKGYTNAAIWVKLTIKPHTTTDPADKLVLRIRPIYLDEIQLFDPLDTSNTVRKSGDQNNYLSAEYESLNHTFVIPMATDERNVYLRLQATSTVLMAVEALTTHDML